MSGVHFLSANSSGRDFIVGDLHGCYGALVSALDKLGFRSDVDRLIAVGDLIDRGPNSLECLSLLDQHWFHSVRGNHEQMMIDAVLRPSNTTAQQWLGSGGGWCIDHPQKVLYDRAIQLDKLPYALIVGSGSDRYNVVHAEFFGSDLDLDQARVMGLTDEQKMSLLWGRKLASGHAQPDAQEGLSVTYCGHTPQDQPRQIGSQVFIDTGACFFEGDYGPGGHLTIVEHGAASFSI